jgi:hypothetical protein
VIAYEDDDVTPNIYMQETNSTQQLDVYLHIGKPGYPLSLQEQLSKKKKDQVHQRESRSTEEGNLEFEKFTAMIFDRISINKAKEMPSP